ncbi:hypothetical protein [Flavobacterium wongokense]|uniref:hypothetical protein n=1 Tax=Flavobacterium wongokense TaxID=2910674 RepID=UPI001F238715|nr:hypothetical protein [Flavobacterium sp. WG47]MCF6133036.1 hypothetical protein [Flavobacterium sp. WG47]
MRSLVSFLVLILLVSCNKSVKDKQAKAVVFKDTIKATNDSVFKVNNILLRAKIDPEKERLYSLETLDGKVIIEPADYYVNIEILDINEDGFKDIRIFEVSNTPNQCQNFFFDPKEKLFRKIKGSDLDIKRLPNANLYYSYNRAGCADMNWESHLIKIENFEEITIGWMEAHDCNDEDDGITFYKIVTLDKILKIDQKPDPNFEIEGKNNKWNYMENYWMNNYKKYQ